MQPSTPQTPPEPRQALTGPGVTERTDSQTHSYARPPRAKLRLHPPPSSDLGCVGRSAPRAWSSRWRTGLGLPRHQDTGGPAVVKPPVEAVPAQPSSPPRLVAHRPGLAHPAASRVPHRRGPHARFSATQSGVLQGTRSLGQVPFRVPGEGHSTLPKLPLDSQPTPSGHPHSATKLSPPHEHLCVSPTGYWLLKGENPAPYPFPTT